DIEDYFTVLDVIYADQFEEETIDQETVEQAEEKFLRGAPAEWLNFHISDLAESNGTGSSFIKRDGYKRLVQQIHKRRNYIGTPTVKLLHQQGCGGTTLAMQVLWEMRKTLRCAALMGSPLECTKIAKEVVHLFTGGSKDDLNTVLLLINEEFILEHLQDSIMAEIEEQQIDVDIPVVILFICGFMKGHDSDYVILKRTLSDTEKEKLDTKKEELSRKYGAKASLFHGFNILHSNFSQLHQRRTNLTVDTLTHKPAPLLFLFPRNESEIILKFKNFICDVLVCVWGCQTQFHRGPLQHIVNSCSKPILSQSWTQDNVDWESYQSNGTGSSFIKRDGYKRLVQQIHKRRNYIGTPTVKLLHQQGCGGTTLAMQVLWEMRKTLRCAALMGSPLECTKIAKEVVHLFTGGSKDDLNTVLLLINEEFILEHLQDSIMAEIEEQQIDVDIPVVILFICVRSDHAILKSHDSDYVILKRTLSDTEKEKLDTKKEELSRKYGAKASQFHGFNILHSNFSQDYIQEACAVLNTVGRKNKPPKTQLLSFLSLLNAYVPGSYLLESDCLDFLRHDNSLQGDLSLVTRMQPFSHLIISFQHDKSCEKRIRMAHPMIAKHCTELLAIAGVPRSDTARNFLRRFCPDEVSPCLFGFIKDLLTKREHKKDGSIEDSDLERFSTLILHINEMEAVLKVEDKNQSASVLKVASKKFDKNTLFPQALARLCYGELEDYKEAEFWAKEAIKRDPKKSFIADTLGQVHKNHLRNEKLSLKPRQLLQLAQKAIEAFEHEEKLAEEEHRKSLTENEKSKVQWSLNTRGQFGFLQVCNILFDKLANLNETWKQVLTKNVPMGSVLESLGDNKLFRFHHLIKNLRDEVEKKFVFFDTFLTYSQSVMKKDKSYVSKTAADCFKKYVGDSVPEHNDRLQQTFQKLKQKLAITSAGVLSCLDRTCTSDIEHINAFVNFILAKIMLSNKNKAVSSSDYKNDLKLRKPPSSATQPEYHLLSLLLFWPTDDEDKPVSDLNQLIKDASHAYEREYKTMFRSRYLRPLFFLGPGKTVNRFVPRRDLEIFWTKNALEESNTNWKNESIFRDSIVEEHLLKVEGAVRNYRVYARFRGTEVEVEANRRDSLCKSGQVSFYLGFTIKGPVAFSVRRKFLVTEGPTSPKDTCDWIKLDPEVHRVREMQTYSLQSGSGCFECSVSTLRWVCKEPISFRYHFGSWEEHYERITLMDYLPAGPVLDISILAGTMEEVYLPHWIGTESTSPDMFAVLHVDACGDSIEKVSDVTSSYVKLLQPTFSPKAPIFLKKLGISVKVRSDVLIFKTIKEYLTLHVYLVPHCLKKKVCEEESGHSSKIISKPGKQESLETLDSFNLTTDADNAEIEPETLCLAYDTGTYFEVCIRNADSDFNLTLTAENKSNDGVAIWKRKIRRGDYKSNIDNSQGKK
uniref:Si:ch73-252p3.1 n=1 Tax=Poecilia formosa TaxID=48698 RepID=A0A087YA91_POEFO